MADVSDDSFLAGLFKAYVMSGISTPSEADYAFNQSSVVLGVTGICAALATVVMVARLYTRLAITKVFGVEDWLIVVIFFSFTAWMVMLILAVKWGGLGKHVYSCSFHEVLYFYKSQYMLSIANLTTNFLTRASILVFLQRLARDYTRFTRILFIIIHVVNFIHWPATMLPTIFMCFPDFRVWDLPTLMMGGCMQAGKVRSIQHNTVAMAIIGVALDGALLVLPIRMIWRLKLPQRQRIAVCGLFGVGFFACIAATTKAVYIAKQSLNTNAFDLSYTGIGLYTSSMLEGALGIVAACAPQIRPLFVHLLPHLTSHKSSAQDFFSSGKSSKKSAPRDPYTLRSIDQMPITQTDRNSMLGGGGSGKMRDSRDVDVDIEMRGYDGGRW